MLRAGLALSFNSVPEDLLGSPGHTKMETSNPLGYFDDDLVNI